MATTSITDRYAGQDLEFAGHKVDVECELLGGEVEGQIKNYIAQDNPGSAEIAVVVAAVKKLYVDDEVVNLRSNKPFPKIRDEEGISLLEYLLGFVVDHERWLASPRKYPQVFARYLDLSARTESDPIKSQAGTRKAS